MNKKQKFLYFICVIGILIMVGLSFQEKTEIKTTNKIIEPSTVVDIPTEKKDGINLLKLQETYQNSDIVAYLSIPNVLNYPIVQAQDNDYYLRRLLDGSHDIKGTPFMDYRTSFGDRKILIYGHSGERDDFPFLALHQYEQQAFYQEHPTIYLYSSTKKYTYEIISSYLETSDYDYVNINSFRGLSWLEHIQKLKNKSQYTINIPLTDDSKILILQTCNIENLAITGRYRLVIGVLTAIENNQYE